MKCINCDKDFKEMTQNTRRIDSWNFDGLTYSAEIPMDQCVCGQGYLHGDVIGAFEQCVAGLLAQRGGGLPGVAVKSMRKAFGFTRQALCELIGVPESTIEAWESGQQQAGEKYEFFLDWVRNTAARTSFPYAIKEAP